MDPGIGAAGPPASGLLRPRRALRSLMSLVGATPGFFGCSTCSPPAGSMASESLVGQRSSRPYLRQLHVSRRTMGKSLANAAAKDLPAIAGASAPGDPAGSKSVALDEAADQRFAFGRHAGEADSG